MEPKDISVEQLLSPSPEEVKPNHPRSRNVSLFDGSTHSISTDIPVEQMRKLVLIADGEIVNITDL